MQCWQKGAWRLQESATTMGLQHSKAARRTAGQDTAAEAAARPPVSSRASRRGTAAAFRAVDARNVNKLWKALSTGAGVGNLRPRPSTSRGAAAGGSSLLTQTQLMSLLEYAVDKNFHTGVAVMLTVTALHCAPRRLTHNLVHQSSYHFCNLLTAPCNEQFCQFKLSY